jgi:hypothetical protein
MTSQEYTQWLKGFLDAVDGYNITKKQFDSIREKLKEVEDTPIGFPIGNGGFGTPAIVPQLGGGWVSSPNIMPLSGTGTITSGNTITTTQFPKGTNITYTDTNGTNTSYTIPTTNNIFTNQSSEDSEKLLMD